MKQFLLLLLLSTNVAFSQTFNITNYGAVGDSITLNTVAIQNAIDSCNAAGGGTVLIPQGIFLSGTIRMKSNVTLRIDSGGTLKGSGTLAHYPTITPQLRTFTDEYVQRSLIYAENVSKIAFEGKGKVNGNGLQGVFVNSSNRVFGFRIFSCTNVRYENLTLQNSAFWMMHNCNIDTLNIRNITITNHCFGNQDGINIDACRNVLVENCDVDANNDPIVMKGTSLNWCENVEVRNCTLATYSRAIKIGTETQGWFKNIHVHDCVVKKSTRGPLGLDAKCGINLSIVDGGSMEDVLIENVSFESVTTPITIRLGNQARKHDPSAPTPGVGFVKNIRLKNITATASSNITSTITGIPGYRAENIWLENVQLTVPGGMDSLPSTFVVPENVSGKPEHDILGDTLPAYGIFVRHINGIQLCNVTVTAQQPDLRPRYIFDDVLNMDSSCVSSVADVANSNIIKVYPNPATSYIYVENENAEPIEVFDLMGERVFASDESSNQFQINVTEWAKGIYFLRSKTAFSKLFIER